ncbi:solute carrier family 36 (proton-coupled amino acid transporter) [Entomortierella parvispora]|uniref:Solute carrier family 36 (Proton-coupled amino acid transporter) n=1 Tax=Entomortierella parvispora TaxID=205924 RepID=A0A9P3LT63_9FUNG|nr:solute carrier family 36 (proton-coupled amino acid transporter) [Entomortierella parvispora]
MNPGSPPRPEYLHSDSSIPTTATLNSASEESAAAGVSRSKSTKRLLAKPDSQKLSINTTPIPDDNQLHAIVGQHLAITPTIPEVPTLLSPSATSPGGVFGGSPKAVSLSVDTTGLPGVTPDSSTIHSAASAHLSDSNLLQSDNASSAFETPSHFNLQGADVSNDVYKWHEKETRAKLNRAQTYHHAPTSIDEDTDIANIKAPGGFRRHFIQQDAATRGQPAPQLPTKSFIHFLGMFNMYEMDHFAGENFHSIPKRSIVVPKDAEKRRQSLARTDTSHRRIFMGEELEEDEEVIEEPEEKIGFSKALGMLFKSFIASGILFLPNAFKNGGIVFAPLFMTLIAALCLHSFLLLVKCRELHPGSFGDIGQRFYGRWMRYLILFTIAISQFGFCCGYCIFFAQQFAIVVDSLGGAHLDKIVWIAIFFAILVPFTFIRNISKLGMSAVIADMCIIVGLIYIYAYDIKQLVINQGSPQSLQLFNKKDFGLFIGTAVFSYEGIGMVIPICSSMKDPKQFPRALTIVLCSVCALLVSFGSLGYAAYGDAVQTIVLDDLPNQSGGEKAGKNAVQLLYVIAIFLTTPLMLFPCIRIMEHVVFSVIGPGGEGTKTRMLKENIVRLVVDFAVAAVAYGGYNKLDIFISFVGSFACAPLLFIFPPALHLKAYPNQPTWRKISDICLILFGCIVFVFTLYTTIKSFKDGA